MVHENEGESEVEYRKETKNCSHIGIHAFKLWKVILIKQGI